MLKLYDQNHNAIGHIRKYKDLCVESDVKTGDKTLSFTYLARHHEIRNEFYIDDGTDEYVVKEVPVNTDGFPQIVAVLNLEELEAKPWGSFSVKDSTIDDAARLALAGTGWTVGECTVTKKRNAGMLQVTSKDVIDKLCTAFMCERVYDTKAKKVHFYDKVGSDKGVYFLRGLNLKKLNKKSDSYDYYTRIIPIGANNLTIESVNGGKNYLENHQYSNKVKTYIWKDESYTNAQALMEDAGLKLEDFSKPVVSYSADVIDLAKQKAGYSVLSYDLGDAVTLIDGDTGIREKQRIVKLKRYPQDHSKDACELANTVLTFEEMQQKYQEAAEIINTVVAGDGRYTGTINVSDILNFEQGLAGSTTVSGMQGSIDSLNGQLSQLNLTVGSIQTNYLKVDEADLKYATIQQLSAVNATVGSIQGDYASFKSTVTEELAAHTGQIDYIQGDLADYKTVVAGDLTAITANITVLQSSKADVTDLNAVTTRTGSLEADMAAVKTLVNGNLTSDNIHSLTLTAQNTTIENGMIKNAMIESLSFGKITGVDLCTTNLTVHSANGRSTWSDNTIQIRDAARVRVQIGEDASGDYTLAVWDGTGKLIWDALGATEHTIQRKIIKDAVVADDAAIQGSKLDIQSVVTEINGSTTKIKTTSIAVDEAGQSLSAYLNTLETTVGDNLDAAKLYADGKMSAAQAYALAQANSALASAKSYAETQANGALQGAKEYADDIEIGGRNILLKSATKKVIVYSGTTITHVANETVTEWSTSAAIRSYGTGGTSKVLGTMGGVSTSTQTSLSTVNYVYSIYIKNNHPTETIFVAPNHNGDSKQGVAPGETKRIIISGLGNNTHNIQFNFSTSTEGKEFDFTYWHPQIEIGNKATDWTPAPEDAESEISNLTEITTAQSTNISVMQGQITTLIAEDTTIKGDYNALLSRYNATETDVSSIKTTISEHTTLIDAQSGQITAVQTQANTIQSDLTGTKQTVSSIQQTLTETGSRVTAAETSISALQGQITLKVEQSDIEQYVTESLGSYSTTAQMNAAIAASADTITQSVAKTYAKQSDLNTVSGKVTSLETWKAEASQKITQEGIIATVGNYYAYKTDLDSVEGRVTEAETTIAQHADEISLRVEKAGIISAINQTAETIKISAGKIDLSGYVTVTNLATAGATTINGGNITTGTISADRIDVTGLFAKDITATGTIRGANLIGATGSFSGEIVANEGRIGNYEIYDDSLRASGIGIYATDKAGVGAFIEVYEVVNERYTTLYQSDGITFRDYKRSGFFGGLRVNSTYDTDTWIYSNLELGYLQYSTGAVHSTIGMDGRTGLIYTEGEIEVGSATTSGVITSSLTSGTYLAGNKGTAIINSTAAAGAYAMLFKLNSTNGVFTGGTYQNKLEYHYTANATINAGTNSPTKTLVLMDESGNSTFPGTFSAAGLIKGSAGASITGAITATGNVSAGGAFYEAGTSLTAKYMRFTTANGYPGFNANGNTSEWMRTTVNGIIPYQSGGSGGLGTSSWPFNTAYIKTIYCTNFAGTTNQRPCCSYNTNGRRVAYVASRGANGTYRGMFNGQFSDNASVTTYQSLGVVVSSSDIRLKENVQDTEVKALPMINRIKMRQFDWKDSGAHQDLGFVADELEMLHPRFATGGGYDEEGNMDIKCVNEFYLLGYLTKAIQEISQEMLTVTAFSTVTAKIQDHESRICSAESKVTQMASREESLQFQLGQAFIKIKELENQISELQASA